MMCRPRIRDTEPPIEMLASAHARTRQVPVTPKICRVPEHAVRLEKAFELRIVDERLALEAVDASRIFGTQPFTQYGIDDIRCRQILGHAMFKMRNDVLGRRHFGKL